MKRIIFFILLLISLIATFVSCDTDGDEVISPTISISDDGFWIINGEKTDIKAEGAKGETGEKGEIGATGLGGVGIQSVTSLENGKLLITYTDGSTQEIEMPKPSDHVHAFGEWDLIHVDGLVSCDQLVSYRTCTECNLSEVKKVTNHVYSNNYDFDTEYHWKQCLRCDDTTTPQEHVFENGQICTVCGLVGSGVADLEKVVSAGKIVVGMECAYAPYNWTTSTPTATTVPISNSPGMYADGYDVQIAKLIASSLGVELVVTAIEWDGLVPALESGEIDMIIAGMSPTEERKLSIDFSDTYFDSNLVMVVKKDGAYASADDIQDFKDAKITGLIYSFHYGVIDQINGVKKQTALADFSALIASLKSGAIDGYVCEKPGAIFAVAANEDLAYVEFAEGKGFECDPAEASISVGIRNDSSLTAEINRILDTLTTADKEAMMDAAIARQQNNKIMNKSGCSTEKCRSPIIFVNKYLLDLTP